MISLHEPPVSAGQSDHFTLPPTRTLLPLAACMVFLDRSEAKILQMVDNGELAWAWDIASAHNRHRREVRIWRESLLAFRLQRNQPTDADEVYRLLMPPRPELRSTDLQRNFCASQGLMAAIFKNHFPASADRNRPLHGPNSFLRVSRAAVVDWLKTRRIGAR